MLQINWNPINIISTTYKKIRSFFMWLSQFSLSKKVAPIFYIVFGFAFYSVPNTIKHPITFPQLYGLYYIALFSCIVFHGPIFSILLYLLLVFLRFLFNGILLGDIFISGVPISRFVTNLKRIPDIIGTMTYEIITVVCFLLFFYLALKLLSSKLKINQFFIFLIAHIIAIVICSIGLTMINTSSINLNISRFLSLSAVLLILVVTSGVYVVSISFKPKRLLRGIIFAVVLWIIYIIALKLF